MTRRFVFEGLGQRLRRAREERGMSLRSLASAIEVSPSLLSQVEIGRTVPSVSTLYALGVQLDISIDELLERDTPSHLSEDAVLEVGNGVLWEQLAASREAGTEALRGTYEPRGSSSSEGGFDYDSAVEHVYLISGELTLYLGFDAQVIRAGESVIFNAQQPHLFVNQQDVPAVGIWHLTESEASSSPRPILQHHRAIARPPASAQAVLKSLMA